MEIIKEFALKHKATIEEIKHIIQELKQVTKESLKDYKVIKIEFEHEFNWLENVNNGDVMPFLHEYKGNIMGRLKVEETLFKDIFYYQCEMIKELFGTDRLIIKGKNFNSVDELMNLKVKRLIGVHKLNEKSKHRFSSRCLKDINSYDVPYYGSAFILINELVKKPNPISKMTDNIDRLMNELYNDAKSNLDGIVVPYYFSNGQKTDLRLKDIDFRFYPNFSIINAKLVFNFYKDKKNSFATHRIYTIIDETVIFK